ncbi:MAG: redoxin domain-containing protein [Planctomycetales bacterium]|nr:redoxin domain-containing protein [Planctomycetales bacterium]
MANLCVAVLFTSTITVRSSISQETRARERTNDEAAHQLEDVSKYLQSLDSFSVQLELATEMTVEEKVHRKPWRSAVVHYRHPNRLLIKSETMTLSANGENLRFVGTSASGKQMYAESRSPTDFKEVQNNPWFRFVARHATSVLSSMLYSSRLHESLLATATQVELSPATPNSQLQFRSSNASHTLLFSNEPPIPVHVTRAPIYRPAKGVPPIRLTAKFSDWAANPRLDEELFVLKIPEDAKRIESPRELLDIKRPDGPDPLIGKAAPNFAIKSISFNEADSAEINLKRYLGKQVVVINFWTTRSATFHGTRPIFEKLNEEFSKEEIAFLAINVAEEEEIVNHYVSTVKPRLGTVLLDSEGAVARAYGITGFPQSFVIDRNGQVSAVFRGFSSDLQERFRTALQKSLNADTLK